MLFRKMLRDMRNNKAQFIAIFLMIFLGVFIYAGVNSDWNGMKVSSQNFYQETNLADVWVYGTGFTNEAVNRLKSVKEIQEVERRSAFETSVKGDKKKKIMLYIQEDNNLSKVKVMNGEAFQENQDGIWMNQTYAQENDLRIGQMYTLEMNGVMLEKEIKGFILHPEMVYQNSGDSILPDHQNQGYAVMSAKYLPMKDVPLTQLLIKTDNPTEMSHMVSDVLEKHNLTYIQKKHMLSYATLNSEIEQHQAFSKVFPIVFLLIAVLTTMTTVSKMIMNQRLQIGVLKALGFKNRKVILHYLSHVVVVASIGAILGFIIGPWIIPALIFPMMRSIYILPDLSPAALISSLYMVFASIFVCFLIAFFVCRKQLQEKPASAIRPMVIQYKKKSHSSQLWNRFNFYRQWNLRDIFRNKMRSLIAVIGVTGCMGLLVCAFGMQNSMDHMVNMMFHELSTFDMRAQIDESANVNVIQNKMDGTAVMEKAIEMQYQGESKTGSLTVQEDNRYLKLQNEDLHDIVLPSGGIALSYNIAQSYDMAVNDVINWRIMGDKDWEKSVVKAIIHTPSSQGITISKDVYEQLNKTFQPTMVVGQDVDVKDMKGVKNIQYLKEDIETSMDAMLEGMNLLIAILMLGAIVLGLVVLYNIGTFSYYEKIRELATLKVLGFRNQNVKKLLYQQNFYVTFVGIILGIPFGYLLIDTVVSTIGDAMDMMVIIQPITYIGCALATLLVSIIVIRVVSRKTKTIDMVSALKAME